MKVVVFGASGMVGQGVLRECLLDAGVTRVLGVGRRALGQRHEKLAELVRSDLTDYADAAGELSGYDACYFCLGVTSFGMSEAEYRKITRDIAVAAASVLVERNPGMTFVFVSGRGSDPTEKGRVMWARVKGEAENALLALPFRQKFVFRPGFIRPLHGIRSRTAAYNALYAVFSPLVPLIAALSPDAMTTTERIGRAMLNVTRHGFDKIYLDNPDINRAAALAPAAQSGEGAKA
jgi:uncharacterized protein YbjT (DUF2867 family)